MNFQKLVITISIIVLIITLIFIGLSLSKSSHSETWPPIVGDCPDYWIDMSGNGEKCLNAKSLGTCNIPTQSNDNAMNFNQNEFSGNNETCAKYKWATACNVTWDGITSGVRNPCDTSS
jgi:hypothetical protein